MKMVFGLAISLSYSMPCRLHELDDRRKEKATNNRNREDVGWGCGGSECVAGCLCAGKG